MKNALLRLLGGLLLLLVGLVGFFFWGSSPNWPNTAQDIALIGAAAMPTAADSTLRVVTYNIGYFSGMTNNLPEARSEAFVQDNGKLALEALRAVRAHVVALQEADFEAQRSFGLHQPQWLAEGLGLPYASCVVNWDKRYVPFPYWPPSAHFGRVVSGQAVLSRFPIASHERHELQKPANNPFYYNAFYIDRLLQVAELDDHGRRFFVLNVHLEAYDYATRLAQSEYVLQALRGFMARGPVLLLGDFNSEPPLPGQSPSPTVGLFLNEPGLASACPPAHFRSPGACTYPADAPRQQIDYIFYSEAHFESLGWKTLGDAQSASDHLPLYWEGRWK